MTEIDGNIYDSFFFENYVKVIYICNSIYVNIHYVNHHYATTNDIK